MKKIPQKIHPLHKSSPLKITVGLNFGGYLPEKFQHNKGNFI